jgi:hypothetical protein
MQLQTANGYVLSECVSALQKCIRRGLFEEAFFWAAEIETRYPDYLWVRLTVIANEDIGLASPQTIMLVETLRHQYFYLLEKSHGPSQRLVLCNVIVAMCTAEKTRLADDLQCVIYRKRDFEEWRLDIPDFALDKHTKRGRGMGRDVAHWRAEGCKLEPEKKGMNPYEDEATALREKYAAFAIPNPKPGRRYEAGAPKRKKGAPKRAAFPGNNETLPGMG